MPVNVRHRTDDAQKAEEYRFPWRAIVAEVTPALDALEADLEIVAFDSLRALTPDVAMVLAKTPLRAVGRGAPLCSLCKQFDTCLLAGPDMAATARPQPAALLPSRVQRSASLYRMGDRFATLYAIRRGSFKTTLQTNAGQEQVFGYHMPGEILGSDGIDLGRHGSDAVALEDAEVCVIPFDWLENLARVHAAVQQTLHRILAREIRREQRIMMLLGSMTAEQRLAAFLVDLSQRNAALGYSSREFVLRLTRAEMGSYLGLKLETVSRLFSRFHREGLIRVQGREVKLLDMPTLTMLLERS